MELCLATATHKFKCVKNIKLPYFNFHTVEVVSKITHICLIWDQTFAKFDV